jgi:hypothetical protein
MRREHALTRSPNVLDRPAALQPALIPRGSRHAAPHRCAIAARAARRPPARCIAPRRAAARVARVACSLRRWQCPRAAAPAAAARRAMSSAAGGGARCVRVARRPRWRTPLVALRRPPARLGWRPRGRKPERLCVQLLLPRLPGQRPVGFERARPAARGCGRVTLVAAAPPAALLGASRRCPPCRSRRVLRRRLWLRLVLRPGAACRAGLASVPRFGRAAGGWRVCLCVWSGVARSHAGLTLD